MRITEKELIVKYFLSQITLMEDDVSKLQAKSRTRKIDVNDSVETTIALVRLELMQQVCSDITTFLRLGGDDK